jgi:hypothetical protein
MVFQYIQRCDFQNIYYAGNVNTLINRRDGEPQVTTTNPYN